ALVPSATRSSLRFWSLATVMPWPATCRSQWSVHSVAGVRKTSSTRSLLALEVACPHRRTDQIHNQPSGCDAGDIVDVMPGRDLDQIHADYPPLLNKSADQLARLQKGDAARHRRGDSGRIRAIHAIEVNG